jgi:6-phosphofructokinase 1
MRIGILTAGGDCPGLNAAIRAVTKGLIRDLGAEVVGFEDGYRGLIEGRTRPLTWRDVSGIIVHGGTLLGSDNRADPFQYLGKGGADVSAAAIADCRSRGIDALVVIGGDGSMTVAKRLHEQGLPIVGVPKTIDNDLVGTEQTIGFDTAVTIATEAVDRIHTTTQSHHRVFLIETMGRYAGWIALHTGIAGGADVILIPELPIDIDEVARVCLARQDQGPRFTLIVVAEGVTLPGGAHAVRERVAGSPESLRLGGIGDHLAVELKSRLQCEVRAIALGHIQRGGSPTPTDRVLATLLGSHAVRMIAAKQFGRVVALQGNRLTSAPLEEVGGRVRTVPPDSPLVTAARSVGVSFGQAESTAAIESRNASL